MVSNATEFLLSIRSAYKSARMFLPEYLTIFVSPATFQQYCNETKANARVFPGSDQDVPYREKYMLRQIRVREDSRLADMGIRITENKKDWEEWV